MRGILDFLLPREKRFIKMLTIQSDILVRGAEEFNNLIINFNKLDKEGIIDEKKRIQETEQKGDLIMRDIIDALHETFITPIDREDIFNLTHGMEDILDSINKTTTKVRMYEIKKMPGEMSLFSKSILDCCIIIRGSLQHLSNYKETRKAIITIHDIEEKSDRLFYSCIDEMFVDGTNAKNIIKFKDIYESVEGAIDICKKVGDIIGQIVVKHG